MTTPTPTALVIGGGIAGLASAIALRRAGYAVTLLERAEAIEPVGTALSLWPNAVAALQLLGVAERVEAEAAPIHTLLSATREGIPLIGPRALADRPFPGARSYLVRRSLLQTALLDAAHGVTLKFGSEVEAVTDSGDAAEVTLADGTTLRADLAIVADGIWSPTAAALLGTEPHYCGYGGVLALSDPLSDPLAEPLTLPSVEYNGAHERFGVFDLGENCAYWFYMRSDPSSAAATALTHADITARTAGWPAAVAGAIAATPPDRLIPFAIHARPVPRRLGRGRLICVGDAAHAMEPNLGQGGCQGLEDAVALGAAAARAAPADILPLFEWMRLARVRRMVRQSAQGRLAAHAALPVRALVRAAMRSLPVAIHDRTIDAMHRLPEY